MDAQEVSFQPSINITADRFCAEPLHMPLKNNKVIYARSPPASY
jgi:hypothetical protein